jgi:site-specific DNA-methyltransferase (adenine-specific)
MSTNTSFTGVHLFHADCVVGMKANVADESVDLVVTSPPYNLGIKYASYEDKLSTKEYLKWTASWAEEVRRCLKPDGSLFLNIAGSLKQPLLPHQVLTMLVEDLKLFHLQNTIHWIKSIAMPGEDGVERQRGHYKPINSERFVNDCHEFIFHLTPTGHTPLQRLDVGVPYADKSNIARWGHTEGKDLKCRGNTWFIPYRTITRRALDRPHPATFPTEVAAKCIKLHGKNGSSVVMDPFLGIGHTALAAAQCKVAGFIGFDIERAYIDVAFAELHDLQTEVHLHV